jgi:integrase
MKDYNKIDPENAVKIRRYPEHKLNQRGYADIILEEERDLIYQKMREIHEPAADFFLTLWHTGMRFNELFQLPINSMFKGKAPDALDEELTRCSISYHGYLVLESQGVYDDHRREEDQSIARKPLKASKKISPKNSRTIPIASKEVWNILARRYKEQKKEYEKSTFGINLSNYLLFQDLEWNKANLTIKKAYELIDRPHKSYHCCRHSFATLMVWKTKSIFLARSITGHKSNAFERYLHVWEQMTLEAQKGEQQIDEIA